MELPKGHKGGSFFEDMAEIKTTIHRRLLERLNLANLELVSKEEAIATIREVVHDLLHSEYQSVALNLQERESLAQEILDEIFAARVSSSLCDSSRGTSFGFSSTTACCLV